MSRSPMPGAPGMSLWRNVDGKHFERVPLPRLMRKAAWGLTPIDIDNDGWIDLAVSGRDGEMGPSCASAQSRRCRDSKT